MPDITPNLGLTLSRYEDQEHLEYNANWRKLDSVLLPFGAWLPLQTISFRIQTAQNGYLYLIADTTNWWVPRQIVSVDYGDGYGPDWFPQRDLKQWYSSRHYNYASDPVGQWQTVSFVAVGSDEVIAVYSQSAYGGSSDTGADITNIDLSPCPQLQGLCLQSDGGLTSLDISPCPQLSQLVASGNALTASAVNNIFATLVKNEQTNGLLDLSQGTNAAPSGQGVTDENTLVSRGWDVATN
jgi:hypothetical protein